METSNSLSSVVKKWGLIYGLISVIFIFITLMLGLQEGRNIAVSIVSWLISVGLAFLMYFLATKEFREGNNHLLSFGKAYVICLLVGLIGGLLKGLGFYLYVKVIDPPYMEKLLEAQMAAQEQFGGGSERDVPEFMEFFLTAEFFALSTFFSVMLGALLLGLIVAAINQKKEDFSY